MEYTLPEGRRIIQKPPMIPSTIPSRGWRPLREPIKFQFDKKKAEHNSPLINEMLTFKPHVSVPDQCRIAMEKKMIDRQQEVEKRRRDEFFKSIVGKVDKLEMPEDPEIRKIEQVSIHCDPVARELGGSFSIKKVESQTINQDDNVVKMKVIQRHQSS